MTVNQPTAKPTNKVAAATIAAGVAEVSRLIIQNIWPEWYDAGTWAALTPVLVLALGYFVKDEANA
jgi:hypothetical protein